MDWYIHLPFESAHNSDDAKTPVAVIVSLQMTPLYGLCGKPETKKVEKVLIYKQEIRSIKS